MLVYRLCSKEEVGNIIKDKDFKNVGTLGKIYKKEKGEIDLNTHIYVDDKKYMHFFPKLDNLFYLGMEKDMYICYYDIPEDILDKNVGFGQYKDYFILSIPRKVLEYSIETNDLGLEYLQQIDLITENISVEDYFDDETLSKFLKTIYIKKNKQHKI